VYHVEVIFEGEIFSKNYIIHLVDIKNELKSRDDIASKYRSIQLK
jgi:hypothetical protein